MESKTGFLHSKETARFKRNLIIGFSISFALLIISSVASYVSIETLINRAGMVDHTNNVIIKTERVISTLKDAEAAQRGFLMTGRDQFLLPFNGTAETVRKDLEDLRQITIDNPIQTERIDDLDKKTKLRFIQLQNLVTKKRGGADITVEELEAGRQNMDDIRHIINTMTQTERRLLDERTQQMTNMASYTPMVIIVTAVLSLVIILVSFLRITRDHENRVRLQEELEEKDRDIGRRIELIRGVAGKIAEGDYSIRTSDNDNDGLGSLASALNRMASSLEQSFNQLADKEWQQSGIAALGEVMSGEKELSQLSKDALDYIANYTNSHVGAFYINNTGKGFKLEAGFGLTDGNQPVYIEPGDGFAGQAIHAKQRSILKDIPGNSIRLNYSAGQLKPTELIALPIRFENQVVGLIELGSLQAYTGNAINWLDAIAEQVGTSIITAINRRQLQALLQETQSQAEELKMQQSALEAINAELEIKTERLQASEEELRVQQEELMQANQELEERSAALEEKNLLINERNLEIQQKAEELTLISRYKSEFLANMSHELRTPLNSILLLSRLLAENNENRLNSDQVEYAQVIQGSGQGLLLLINDILDLSKIEAGKMTLEFSDVNIAELLQENQRMFQHLAADKGLTFALKTDKDIPTHLHTDRLRLDQVLRNLLSNALKFTEQGAVTLEVSAPQKGFLRFTVTDTGIGIPADKQQMVFEAFQQADGSTRRKYGGTGLGLSITRELVKLLGGQITLKSEPGKGSQFSVVLPMDQKSADQWPAAETEARQVRETSLATLVNSPSSTSIPVIIPENIPDDRLSMSAGDKSIVIVEDDIGFAKALVTLIRQRGYKAIVTVRGDEAVDLVNRYQPTGVLLDIELPVKNGWQVMEELKSNPRTRHIPVHIMSSHEAKNKSLLHGAVDFLNKPLAMDQLNEVFRKIEYIVENKPQKVLIVEENSKHAKALAYYLETFDINTEIKNDLPSGIHALHAEAVNCVILDMGIPGQYAYDSLEKVKASPRLENIPIIIFTGRSLSKTEEMRIKQYADSIVVKTAHSYHRILDEVSLFLHLVTTQRKETDPIPTRRLGALKDVLAGKTALVADDDVRNIFSLTKTLESLGMKVLAAIDGKEAVQTINEQMVDVVLMDMMMPEMDGYESIRQIRENQRFRRLPIIAVTAKAMTGDREKCIAAGASDYITKPVDIDQLLSLLRVWLYENS